VGFGFDSFIESRSGGALRHCVACTRKRLREANRDNLVEFGECRPASLVQT
jgi:hypothetical protein